MNYSVRDKFFESSRHGIIGIAEYEIDQRFPEKLHTVTNPVTSRSLTLPANMWEPVDSTQAIAILDAQATENSEKNARLHRAAGKAQSMGTNRKAANLAAEVIAYVTGGTVLFEPSNDDASEWVVYADLDFWIALFILRTDTEPFWIVPSWWKSAKEVAKRHQISSRQDVALGAASQKYYRHPGEEPKLGKRPNAWAQYVVEWNLTIEEEQNASRQELEMAAQREAEDDERVDDQNWDVHMQHLVDLDRNDAIEADRKPTLDTAYWD